MNEKEWKDYKSKIDAKIKDIATTEKWGDLIYTRKGFKHLEKLFRHIVLVMNRYLESDEEKALFIKLPIEEIISRFGNEGDSEREIEAYEMLSGAILTSLAMATVEKFKKDSFPVFNSHILEDRPEFNIKDCFCCKNIQNESPIYSEVILDINTGKKRLRFNGKTNPTQTFNEECDKNSFIRISSIPTTQHKAEFNRIQRDIALIEKIPSLSKNYDTASLIVSYTAQNDKIPIRSNLILPYNLSQEFSLRNASNDILVLVGDKIYKDKIQSIFNKKVKKTIFIGSEFPKDREVEIIVYEFSSRETHEYISVSNNKFELPKATVLEFPWLIEAKENLKKRIAEFKFNEQPLEEKLQNRIVNYSISCMFGYNFDADKLNEIKKTFDPYSLSKITYYDMIEEGLSDILYAWLDALSFDNTSSNPKKEYCDKKNDAIIIENNTRIPKRLIKQQIGEGKKFIINTLSIYPNRFNIIDYILRYNVKAQIEILYYEGCEDSRRDALNRYIDKEESIYNADIRDKWTLKLSKNKTNNTTEKESIDEEQEILDDAYYYNNAGNLSNEAKYYKLTLDDNSTITLQGDVLIQDEDNEWSKVSLYDIKDQKDILIKYYQTAENINEYGYRDMKEEIDRCSKLWQEHFRAEYISRLAHQNEEDIIKDFAKELGISNTILRTYTNENNNNKFIRRIRDMRSICNWLIQQNRIKEEDKNSILLAQRNNSRNVIIGKRLKIALFDYILHGRDNNLSELKDKGQEEIDNLINNTIREAKVQNIKEIER